MYDTSRYEVTRILRCDEESIVCVGYIITTGKLSVLIGGYILVKKNDVAY